MSNIRRPATLKRALTTWDVAALGVNGVIGGGIFLAPAIVARHAGSWSPFVYLFSGALVALIALCFAEVGGRFGRAGGPFIYAQSAFGPFTGFQIGWFAWIARVTSLASLANGLVTYAAYLNPEAGVGPPRLAILALLFGSLTIINILGVGAGAWTINVLTIVKLAPLALFVTLGVSHIEPGRLAPGAAPPLASLFEAALFMIYVFGGFEVLTFPAEEMISPSRAVPRAVFSTMAVVAVVYLFVHITAMGTLDDLSKSSTPVADAARGFMGQAGGLLITLGALLSICGTESGLMLTSPRLLYAMADQGHLPAALTRVHDRFRTPHVAIALQGSLGLLLAAFGTFEELARLSAIARIVTYAATCLAVPVFRKRPPAGEETGKPEGFTVPGGMVVPATATILCVLLVATSSAAHLILGAAALLAGSVLYRLLSGAGRASRAGPGE